MFTGAKHYAALAAVALAASGCSGLERLAPPGIVKYEDLAKDQPPNPEIVERVEIVRAASDGGYPKLSEQPQKVPEAAPATEREIEAATLRQARDELAEGVADARAESERERAEGVKLRGVGPEDARPLDEAAAALDEAVAKADAEARRERGLPPRPAEPDERQQ